MLRYCLLFLFLSGTAPAVIAQTPKCGYDHVRKKLMERGFTLHEDSLPKVAFKTTQNELYTIPVIFHVLLTQVQLNQLGGEDGLIKFLDSQVVAINRDFNARNRDSIAIPAPFKALYANVGINFGYAHTAPDGSATPGYELKVVSQLGFNLDGTYGSGIGFSNAKYNAGGGLDAWDPATYLNIWVINPLEAGTTTNILGLTISPSFADYYNMPDAELGITIHYKSWNSLSNFRGRTLTHELGHYFGLRHVWGDDEGKCPFNGGEDDGIEDTPPQSNPTYRCPQFPVFDACSPSSTNGIMFMNFMDYTDDYCQVMFTKGQVNRMMSALNAFGDAYPLTQHPRATLYPDGSDRNMYSIYPNPSPGKLNVRFNRTPEGLQHIRVLNISGQVVSSTEIKDQRGFYLFDLSQSGSGMYFVQLKFTDRIDTEKIILVHQ